MIKLHSPGMVQLAWTILFTSIAACGGGDEPPGRTDAARQEPPETVEADAAAVSTAEPEPEPAEVDPPSCDGETERSCGSCGLQERSCEAGKWGDWSLCHDEGSCAPGETRACGEQGMQRCGESCQWSACTGQSCAGAAQEACGNCGTRTRSCDPNTGTWSTPSACTNEGTCAPGASRACGMGGNQYCDTSCGWGACGGQSCEGPATQACGKCGTTARTCDPNSGLYGDWSSCTNEGVCTPGETQSCNGVGQRVCADGCQWSACMCLGEAAVHCGQCGRGTQQRACQDGQWNPVGACDAALEPQGGDVTPFGFDDGTVQGFQMADLQESTASGFVPLENLGVRPAVWVDDTQNSSPAGVDPLNDQRGSIRYDLHRTLVTASGQPSYASVDFSVPLTEQSGFHDHVNVAVSVLADFRTREDGADPNSAPTYNSFASVQAIYKVEKCDGKTSYFASVDDAKNYIFCTATNGAWKTCKFPIDAPSLYRAALSGSGVSALKELIVRVFFYTNQRYDGAVYLDSIRPE
jgi:hypothetical protein